MYCIAQNFVLFCFQPRELSSLMEKYKAIKKELRKALAKERQQAMATGGDQASARNPMLDVPEFVELLEIIRFSATGRQALYDNDLQLDCAQDVSVDEGFNWWR